jgi:hypothetical protein
VSDAVKKLPFDHLPGAQRCDFSDTTIRMAMHELGPAHVYTLCVSPRELLHASNHVRQWTNAPLAHQINVAPDPALESIRFGWYLHANGRSLGSTGA